MPEREIVIPGIAADRAWENIQKFPGLLDSIRSNSEISRYSPMLSKESKALLVTFCQVICFGDNGFPHSESSLYKGKLGRNRYLAEENESSLGLVLVEDPVKLVFEGELVHGLEVPLNFCVGATVIYPLNKMGAGMYKRNSLPPHRFMREHLISDDSFEPAEAVFVGGAIDLKSVSLILGLEKQDWPKGNEPGALIHRIAKDTVSAFNPVNSVIDGPFGPTLRMESENEPLPIVYTAFGGKGLGEGLANDIKLQRESQFLDSENGSADPSGRMQRRWNLDLNDLNRVEKMDDGTLKSAISMQRRKDILLGWSWFLKMADSQEHEGLVRELEDAAS